MFGLSPLIFSITILEVLLLFFQTFSFLARTKDKSRKRFLVLIIIFIIHNIIGGTMPNEAFGIPLLVQHISLNLVGIWLASYYFYYLVVELDLLQIGAFTVRKLILSLCVSFIVVYFTAYFLSEDFNVARKTFIVVPIIIGTYFCFKTVQFLIQKWRQLTDTKTPYGTIIIASNIGIIFMATMPITEYIGNTDLNIGLTNVSLVVSSYAYLRNYIFQSRLEYQFLNKIGFYSDSNIDEKDDILAKFRNYNLTSRELDIAMLIIQEKPYKEIGEHMFISPKTVSKHASNIFKKTSTSRRSDFIAYFNSSGQIA